MVHYHDHIKNFGSPNGLCSSITESKHITAVKRPWRRSNKHAALPQMLKVNQRIDKIAAARADFTARGMLTDSCLIQAIKDMFSSMSDSSEDPMGEDASDSDESDNESSHFNDTVVGANTHIPDDRLDGEPVDITDKRADPDDDRSDTSRQPSPIPPDSGEDDDYGPVEVGPLMNEVRLVGRKG